MTRFLRGTRFLFPPQSVLATLQAPLLALALAGAPDFCAAAVPDEETTLPECCRPRPAEAPRVHVVTFRTDDCEACRILEPVVAQVADEFTSEPVHFVTLDFSTPRLAKQSEYLAHSLSMDELWKNFARQSGFVLVLDGPTRKPLAKITRFDGADVLREAIRKVLVR